MHLKCRFAHYCLPHSTAFKQRSRKNIRLVYIVCVYVMCMCWKDEVGIIHTHDSIPYKLLDKGFRFFFYSSLTHPLLPPFFFKASFDFDPTLHHERHLCQSLCPPRSPAPPCFPLSIQTSSPHCLIAGSVLLRFSQHGKTLSLWGRNLSTLYKQSKKKRELSLPIPLSLSLSLCNLNFPLLSLMQYIHLWVCICFTLLSLQEKFFLLSHGWWHL